MVTIEVETIDFDTQACMLRLKGRNVEENQYIKVQVLLLNFIPIYLFPSNLPMQFPDGSLPHS